jgi:hypothetical protein
MNFNHKILFLFLFLFFLVRRFYFGMIECKQKQQGGVSHYGLAIYILKYFKAKEELWKFKYFTM